MVQAMACARQYWRFEPVLCPITKDGISDISRLGVIEGEKAKEYDLPDRG
jgi:hypothetical protein